MAMNVLDLFSGIGGFSLGLERAGMRTVAFCEIDPYCQRVLRKHWPDVPIYDDVRTLTAARLMADGNRKRCNGRPEDTRQEARAGARVENSIDLICGGFPCQDISIAGKGAGITGERSGLWSEFARIIGEVRPQYVIVENVSALLGRGLARILGDLAALGFDAEWHCIPASAIGAPHRRDRVWIVAYAIGDSIRNESRRGNGARRGDPAKSRDDGTQTDVANTNQPRLDFTEAFARELAETTCRSKGHATERPSWWQFEPDVGRVAHGISNRVDRLRTLGNAIVPQIAEIIGRAIVKGKGWPE
jgi:DNA (cytosine-5)-methyltransferase 1